MRYQLSASQAEFYEGTFVPALFGAWARRLVTTARPWPGMAVLDVACGTGIVARTAADITGPSHVVGLDRNEDMLAVARRIRPDLRWVRGDAGALPFRSGAFGLVLCQAGLMFFDDRAGALREMGRVGGQVAVQVPGRLAESPGYRALAEVVDRHAGPEVRDLLGAYFAVGSPELLRGLFDEAGLRITGFETWQGATVLPSIDDFLAVELLPLEGRVEDEVRERITADCRTALAPFIAAEGVVAAPIEVHLVVATA